MFLNIMAGGWFGNDYFIKCGAWCPRHSVKPKIRTVGLSGKGPLPISECHHSMSNTFRQCPMHSFLLFNPGTLTFRQQETVVLHFAKKTVERSPGRGRQYHDLSSRSIVRAPSSRFSAAFAIRVLPKSRRVSCAFSSTTAKSAPG